MTDTQTPEQRAAAKMREEGQWCCCLWVIILIGLAAAIYCYPVVYRILENLAQ